MKQYQCHKKVHAAKILEINVLPGFGRGDHFYVLSFDDGSTATIEDSYKEKHSPHVGGYYVLYEGGYESFSPAEAFESGYTEVND